MDKGASATDAGALEAPSEGASAGGKALPALSPATGWQAPSAKPQAMAAHPIKTWRMVMLPCLNACSKLSAALVRPIAPQAHAA